jgi:hypothetical protein
VVAWKFHHPLGVDQLDFGAHVARVQAVSFYHGGDQLYQLAGVPGVWHEQLLRAATPEEAAAIPAIHSGSFWSRRSWAIVFGLVAALVVGPALYVGFMFLGAATGVIAMCANAPDWWAYTFFGLLFVCPVAGAFIAGLGVGKWYLHRA